MGGLVTARSGGAGRRWTGTRLRHNASASQPIAATTLSVSNGYEAKARPSAASVSGHRLVASAAVMIGPAASLPTIVIAIVEGEDIEARTR